MTRERTGRRARYADTGPDEPSTFDVQGPRRILLAVYGVFALAATARATVQILTSFDEAPLAYLLSLLAGVVYIAATIGLLTHRPWSRPLAWTAVLVEAVGVLVVGTLSFVVPEVFPHDTVWSRFGSGYVYMPAVLPVFGLLWLRASSPRRSSPPAR